MLLAVYSHYMVGDPFERLGPSLVFSFMLIGRLVIWYQVRNQIKFENLMNFKFKFLFQVYRKEKLLEEAAQAQQNGMKQD